MRGGFNLYGAAVSRSQNPGPQLDGVLMTLTSMGLPADVSSSKYEAMALEAEDPLRKVRAVKNVEQRFAHIFTLSETLRRYGCVVSPERGAGGGCGCGGFDANVQGYPSDHVHQDYGTFV